MGSPKSDNRRLENVAWPHESQLLLLYSLGRVKIWCNNMNALITPASIEDWERIILTYLRPLVSALLGPLQFAYHPDFGVDDAVICLLHRSLSHLKSTGSSVRVMFFLIFHCVQYNQTSAEGEAGRSRSRTLPNFRDSRPCKVSVLYV